jgi:Flp pilus assembly protein TadG
MKSSRFNQRAGAALAEFAVVMPILFLVFAAMIEIGRMLLLQQTADTAAYEGARHAMVSGADAEEGLVEAKRLLKQANIKDAKVAIDPTEIVEDTPTISVRVSIPLSKNCWFFKAWSDGHSVTSEVTLLSERVPLIKLTGIPELKKKAKEKKDKKDDDDD